MKKIMMTVAATVAVISIAAPAHAANTINGGGATFPYPLYQSDLLSLGVMAVILDVHNHRFLG